MFGCVHSRVGGRGAAAADPGGFAGLLGGFSRPLVFARLTWFSVRGIVCQCSPRLVLPVWGCQFAVFAEVCVLPGQVGTLFYHLRVKVKAVTAGQRVFLGRFSFSTFTIFSKIENINFFTLT